MKSAAPARSILEAGAALTGSGPGPAWLGLDRGHILFRRSGRFWAVPEELGSWDLGLRPYRLNPRVLSAASRGELDEALRDRLEPCSGPPEAPRRIEMTADGFVIYSFQSRYFAVPAAEGALDPARFRAGGYSRAVVGHTIGDVREEVARAVPQRPRGNRRAARKAGKASSERALVVAAVPPGILRGYLEVLGDRQVTLLAPHGYRVPGLSIPALEFPGSDFSPEAAPPELLARLRSEAFDLVVLPYEGRRFWDGIALERLAAEIARRILVLFPGGRSRLYRGEDVRRIQYNKAYLNSMFRRVPELEGKRVLEVGSSDGLACDLLLCEAPAEIVGVDVMEMVGCSYRDPAIRYERVRGTALPFEDESFDLTFSIATMEHVSDPFESIREMARVTHRGGWCYIQAAPLYFSPFGHHMFGHFDDLPWIHLRRSPEEIIAEGRRRGMDARCRDALGQDAESYVRSMLDSRHVNGRTYGEYRLDAVRTIPGIEIVSLTRSWEGRDLLAPEIRAELRGVSEEDLVSHGFELVLKKIG